MRPKKNKITVFSELLSHFPSFSWCHLDQQGGATWRLVRAVENRTGRRPLSVSSLWECSTHSLLQEQLPKVLATCQKAAGCKNKLHPLTVCGREEMQTLCLSYKPELSNARRAEGAALKRISLSVFITLCVSLEPPLLPLPWGILEKSGCSRCCQSRFWQNIT